MSAAKTVSHSPMRPNQDKAFLKNALDNPFKTKWQVATISQCNDFMTSFDLCRPVLSQTAVKTIKEQLERSECLCNGFLENSMGSICKNGPREIPVTVNNAFSALANPTIE